MDDSKRRFIATTWNLEDKKISMLEQEIEQGRNKEKS